MTDPVTNELAERVRKHLAERPDDNAYATYVALRQDFTDLSMLDVRAAWVDARRRLRQESQR